MNKKERRLALATALQSAASDVVVVEDIKQAAGGDTGPASSSSTHSTVATPTYISSSGSAFIAAAAAAAQMRSSNCNHSSPRHTPRLQRRWQQQHTHAHMAAVGAGWALAVSSSLSGEAAAAALTEGTPVVCNPRLWTVSWRLPTCAVRAVLLSCPLLPGPAADGKTKSLVSALSKVAGGADKKVLLVLGEADAMVMRAGRNVEKLAINTADSVQVGRATGWGDAGSVQAVHGCRPCRVGGHAHGLEAMQVWEAMRRGWRPYKQCAIGLQGGWAGLGVPDTRSMAGSYWDWCPTCCGACLSTADCLVVLRAACCCCLHMYCVVQVYDVLNADVIVMEKSALQTINSTYGPAAESSA